MSLERLAELTGRPVADLTRLDTRSLAFAFVDGDFEAHTLRVKGTNEMVRLATTSDGELVDPDELGRRSRELVARYASKMDPDLRQLLQRHPEIDRVRVHVQRIEPKRSDPSDRKSNETRTIQGRQVTQLAVDPEVRYIELAAEPEVLDDG